MSQPPRKVERPLSPHLQVYKPQISSVLSILHRVTGVGLSFGLVLLTIFLVTASSNADCYNAFADFMNGIIGRLLIVGFSVAMFYHLCSGIRHLLWDLGWGFDVPTMNKTGWMVVIASIGGAVCYLMNLLIIATAAGV